MNAMEGRTREALHRVADGLVVSEHDLDRMEGNLMTLLDSRPTDERTTPRRQRDWLVAAVAAVALVVGSVALWQANTTTTQTPPAGRLAPSEPLVPPELVGLWQNQPAGPWLWEFTADGRITYTDTAAGYLDGGQGKERVIQRNGDLYTLVDSSTTPGGGCAKLRIRVVGPGILTVGSGCPGDSLDLRLEKVSPRDTTDPQLTVRFPNEVRRHVTLGTQLEGSWIDQETGRVLVVGLPRVGGELPYMVDDDGDGLVRPDQRGVLTVEADGSVRAQPSSTTAASGGCTPAFSSVFSTTATLVTTSGADSCYPQETRQTWLRLN